MGMLLRREVSVSCGHRRICSPALIAHGEQLFSVNCSFCHGSDARGGEGGPNLLRDQLVMDDQNGELITNILQNGIPDKGMPKFAMLNSSDEEAYFSVCLVRGGRSIFSHCGARVRDRCGGAERARKRCRCTRTRRPCIPGTPSS